MGKFFDFNADDEMDAFASWLMYNAMQDSESSDDNWDILCDDDNDFDWRDSYDDDFDNNIFPEDYDTEEEFLEALDETNHDWRVNDSAYGIDPDDYETEEEYEDALEAFGEDY